ncbi:MAG TPA: tetratricopeptide repeat protein [Sedimentisphaerales bacterium]|nr:tetratricopeptide repeat protein [Sedimentisphaerales bacterium]
MSKNGGRNLFFILLSVFSIIAATTVSFQLTQCYYKNFVRGKRFFIKGDYETSLNFFESAYVCKPEKLELLQYLTWNYSRVGNQEKTLEMLAKMVQVNPDDYKSRIWLGDTYYGLNDYAKAEQVYRNVLEREDSIKIRKSLAEVLVWQRKFEPALKILSGLEEIAPQNIWLLKLEADIYVEQQEFAKAESVYRKLIHLDRDGPYYEKLAEVLAWQKKYEESIALLEKIIDQGGGSLKQMELLADVYCWSREYVKSTDMYYKVLSMGVEGLDRKRVTLKLADVFRYSNRNSDAIKLYDQYLAKENDLQ